MYGQSFSSVRLDAALLAPASEGGRRGAEADKPEGVSVQERWR